MKEEQKQLLLKDLCARLPYGVKILADIDKIFDGGCIGILNMVEPYVGTKCPELKGQYLLYEKGSLTPLTVEEVRPYLRPMSSMTEEEREDFAYSIANSDHSIPLGFIDYCNEHHFDYRGLIDKGLALEAKDGMYKAE